MSGVSNVCIVTDKALVPGDGRQKHVKWGGAQQKGGVGKWTNFRKMGGHNKVILVEKNRIFGKYPPPPQLGTRGYVRLNFVQ